MGNLCPNYWTQITRTQWWRDIGLFEVFASSSKWMGGYNVKK